MKSLFALAMLLLILPIQSFAQSGSKALDPAFVAFWTKFKAAVAKDDKEAVATMTKLPFFFDSKEQKRDGFIKIYDKLFTARVKKCFATAKPVKDGDDYEIFCGKSIYLFGKVNGSYKFTEIGVDD
jgi:hypothetical protein